MKHLKHVVLPLLMAVAFAMPAPVMATDTEAPAAAQAPAAATDKQSKYLLHIEGMT